MEKEKILFDLRQVKEMIPDVHDGSYELMREIVSSYGKLTSWDECSYLDLNAVYAMAIGTWKLNVEKKKEYVCKSCLPEEEKSRMASVIDKVWDNACNEKYENMEKGKPSIGMFGTGFYSFENKTTKECATAFVRLLVDISAMADNDDAIFDKVSEVLDHDFKGMRAASASVVLHCLKPYVFPILNGNMGSGNIYGELGVELKRPGNVDTYIFNCKKIKEFRDGADLQFKNYRIFDQWAGKVDRYRDDEFVPSYDDYDPGISQEEYEDLLQNEKVVPKANVDVLYFVYKLGGIASCSQIASKYGNTPQHYNSNATYVAKRIHEETKCLLDTRDNEQGDRFWSILFQGRPAHKGEEGTYIWRMRKPLADAIDSLDEAGFFEKMEYVNTSKQEKYELTITADDIVSTDDRFTMDNISLGDNYKPIDAYFESATGEVTRRKRNKSENRISNQTLPRLACQIFESQLNALSDMDKASFPICQYTPKHDLICGIYPSKEEYKKQRNSMEMMVYKRENGPQFVFYSWNLFSTLLLVKECLKRFGNDGDKFVFIYRDKTDQEKNQTESEKVVADDVKLTTQESKNPYSKVLLESKNIIFRGAPGTGKSYLAKEIAADIISNGYTDQYADLTPEQKQQIEFVQFHPSYDYSDFVEGLRPKMNDDGSMGFELQDGIFKRFVAKARKNYEDSLKTKETVEQEMSIIEAMNEFLANVVGSDEPLKTTNGSEFYITDVNEGRIDVYIPKNDSVNSIRINIDEIKRLLEADITFEKNGDITRFLGVEYTQQRFSYDLAIYREILKIKETSSKTVAELPELKKYIFIIDEINRGEISKILGELFFSIDPGYRGRAGEVSTQYSNMHTNPEEKFYIPENVYIIGTMNDIDRSVDSFDFAMRRRFRFVEIKAEDTQDMLESLDEELKNEAVERMDKLNAEIIKVEDLNENYQIGAAYFLKLKSVSFDVLWTDYLSPLLEEYVRGLYDEEGIMKRFAKAYGYMLPDEGVVDETTQD